MHANLQSSMIIRNVNDGSLELPGRDPSIEEDIDLSVASVLEFGQEEVGENEADDSCAAPDITTFTGDIPAGGVEELRCH